ncbi:MAG: fibronectin type III domain-containing protein [Polyangiaceae bacterium]
MRWFAAATVSLVLCSALLFGCSAPSDGAVSDTSGGTDGTAGSGQSAGKGGRGSSAGSSGTPAGGDAGSNPAGDAGSSGAPDIDPGDAGSAGDTSAQGGTGGMAQGGSTAGTGASGGAPATVPNAPSELTPQVASATSIQLLWNDNSTDETGFNIYWSTTTDKPATPSLQQPVDSTSAIADGLVSQTPYNFWVESYNSAGVSTAITGVATPVSVPSQATGFTVTSGATTAVLNWADTATGETGYHVYYSTTNTLPTTATKELPANSTTFTVPDGEMAPYTTYYFWVAAYNAAGSAATVAATGFVGVKPNAPTGMAVDATSHVWYETVTWADDSASTTSYNVYWSTNDTQPTTPQATVPAGTTSYQLTQLQCTQTYRVWIETVNAIGKSAATKATANGPVYDIPWGDLYWDETNQTVHQSAGDTFGLAGDNNAATGVYGYHAATQVGLATATANAMDPSIQWTGIGETATQFYQTEWRTPGGSLFSSVRSLSPPAALGAITPTLTDLNIKLTWALASGAVNYYVYVSTSAAFSTATQFGSYGSGTTTATVTNLNPGILYYYWVRAAALGYNGQGYNSQVGGSASTTGTNLGPNLAIGKTAVASTVSNGLNASNAIDNNIGSRWQANNVATEWIYVDLGTANVAKITNVELAWESAYSSAFFIQTCIASCSGATVDAWPWTTVSTQSSVSNAGNNPYFQMITLTTPLVASRYIRMKSKTLAQTAYGPSLYEFEVFSTLP